jgi:uncharacterized protein (TIGR02246 family)
MSVIEEAPNLKATTDVVAVAEAIMERLERAWNSANGVAFGEPFSTDADFVAIRGDLHTGRSAIAEGHQQIFDTIYAGSTARYEVLQARELDDRVILANVRCTVNAPSGPLAGEHASTATIVLLKRDERHEIAAFHNTLITG